MQINHPAIKPISTFGQLFSHDHELSVLSFEKWSRPNFFSLSWKKYLRSKTSQSSFPPYSIFFTHLPPKRPVWTSSCCSRIMWCLCNGILKDSFLKPAEKTPKKGFPEKRRVSEKVINEFAYKRGDVFGLDIGSRKEWEGLESVGKRG